MAGWVRTDDRQRAISIASQVGRYLNRGRACHEPIQRLLERLSATLAAGRRCAGPACGSEPSVPFPAP